VLRCPLRLFISAGVKSLVIPTVASGVRNRYTKMRNEVKDRFQVGSHLNMIQKIIKATQ